MSVSIICRSSPCHSAAGGMECVAKDLVVEWRWRGHGVTYTLLQQGSPRSYFVQLTGSSGWCTRTCVRRGSRLSLEGFDRVLIVSSASRSSVGSSAGVPSVAHTHGTSVDELKRSLRPRSMRALVIRPKNLPWLVSNNIDYRKYTAVGDVGPAVTRTLQSRHPRFAVPRNYFEIRDGIRASTSREAVPWKGRQGVMVVGRLHVEKSTGILLCAVGGMACWSPFAEMNPIARLDEELRCRRRSRTEFTLRARSPRRTSTRKCVGRGCSPFLQGGTKGLAPPIFEAFVDGTLVVKWLLRNGSLPHMFSDGFSIAADLSPEAFRDALFAHVNQAAHEVRSLRDRSGELTIGHAAGACLDLFDQLRKGETS